MVTPNLWLSFVATKAIISITPGPAVMLVVSQGLGRGRAQWAAAGVVLVNALYFVIAALGLGAVLSISPESFVIVRWIAAVYLMYSGMRMLLAGARTSAPDRSLTQSGWRSCATGILLQLANPNALLFFAAVLPTFVSGHRPLGPQILTLGITGLALDGLVLTAYGLFAMHIGQWATAPEVRVVVHRLAACLLIGMGVFALMSL